VMFFLSMIPMAGSFLVWGPASLYLFATGAWVQALILIAFGVLVIGTIDNVLAPKLIGQRVAMHELLIFFAVLGGIQLFGVLGLILGPVVVAVTLALIAIIREAGRPENRAILDS
jgi:predicted PurR-regulated permease PerM